MGGGQMSTWRYMEGGGVNKWPKKRHVAYGQPLSNNGELH